MHADALRRMLWMHNGRQVLVGAVWLLFSAVLWWLSYVVLWRSVVLYCALADVAAEPYATLIAFGGLAVLVWQAVRGVQAEFGLANDRTQVGFWRGSRVFKNVAACYALSVWAEVLSNVFQGAPHALLAALRAFRSVTRASDSVVAEAASILDELRRARRWIPVEKFRQTSATAARALRLLRKLDVIWIGDEDGEFAVRYPAAQD